MGNKTIDTLIADVYKLFDPDVDHIADEANVEAAGEAFKEALRQSLRKYEKRGDLRFSGLGKGDRQLWFDKHGNPEDAEKLTPNTYLKFLYGHLLEAMIVFFIKESGHDVSCEQEEVEVDGVKGHLDLVVDGVLLDVKSASPFGFKKFAAGEITPEDDAFGYIQQLSGYATVKGLPAAFLAIEKVSAELALSPLSEYAIKGHPPADRIAHLKGVLSKDAPPPRCAEPVADGKSGNMKLPTLCSYCKWKYPCYADANNGKGLRLFAYSNGPRWLSNVAKEPDVYEVKDR